MKEEHKFKKKIEDMDPDQLQKQQQEVKTLKLPEIKTIDFLYNRQGKVTYEYPELIALCPMTGIPDLYTVRIIYVPDEKIPELKSFRAYLISYKDIPILHEHLANKIFKDFKEAVKPKKIKLELDVAVRGGIYTTIVIDDKE